MTMTTGVEPPADQQNPAPPPGSRRWLLFGVSNLVVVVVVSVLSWYLLADPTSSPWHFYPLPFNAALFWAILFIVFIGFNSEFVGFDRLGQPLRGIAVLVSTAVFAVAVTCCSVADWVRCSPTSPVPAPAAWATSRALFVLFGFGTWVMVVLNWQHWPWTALGMKQPLIGLCEIAFVAIPTLALYIVIGLPAVSSSVTNPMMSLDTVLGWFYSIVVSVILTGQTLDNWPWKLFGGGGKTALAATIGNALLGTTIYFVMVPLAKLLVGSQASAELGNTIHQFPAQIGVCWAFWMIFWANGFGNRFAPAVRAVLTFVLAVGTFLLYYRFAAGNVLHEPAVASGLAGNALGFVDWLVLWTLIYVVAFQSMGLRRLVDDPEPADVR